LIDDQTFIGSSRLTGWRMPKGMGLCAGTSWGSPAKEVSRAVISRATRGPRHRAVLQRQRDPTRHRRVKTVRGTVGEVYLPTARAHRHRGAHAAGVLRRQSRRLPRLHAPAQARTGDRTPDGQARRVSRRARRPVRRSSASSRWPAGRRSAQLRTTRSRFRVNVGRRPRALRALIWEPERARPGSTPRGEGEVARLPGRTTSRAMAPARCVRVRSSSPRRATSPTTQRPGPDGRGDRRTRSPEVTGLDTSASEATTCSCFDPTRVTGRGGGRSSAQRTRSSTSGRRPTRSTSQADRRRDGRRPTERPSHAGPPVRREDPISQVGVNCNLGAGRPQIGATLRQPRRSHPPFPHRRGRPEGGRARRFCTPEGGREEEKETKRGAADRIGRPRGR